MMNGYTEIRSNRGLIRIDDIPVIDYSDFCGLIDSLLDSPSNHCINYFAVPQDEQFRFFCIIGCDEENSVRIFSHITKKSEILPSITKKHNQFNVFERLIHEKHGIEFEGHPWLKPVRSISNYSFYSIESDQLHEVGVGPVHAGVIEPGHFRFICNGEKVLHLEIQLGFQHRGIEDLMITNDSLLRRMVLAEGIAGDTTIGHAITHAEVMESLLGIEIPDELALQRMIALEMERMAVHIGDTAALCTDTAYQFGQVVCEALRTIVINTTQLWCGNRFGKGLIRTGSTNYPLTTDIAEKIRLNLKDVIERYTQISAKIFSIPSVLNRFEGTGVVTKTQAQMIGAVGMAARSSGLKRDIRWSHPGRKNLNPDYEPALFDKGDVWARGMVRRVEIHKSYNIIFGLLDIFEKLNTENSSEPHADQSLQKNSLSFSLTEGWRGEICHAAVTDIAGRIIHYDVKDPSLHNWMALALAVRDQEISDFPLCNKSFNLSYCGHDL